MAERRSFEETHENILRGALEVFSRKGYSAATIKDISERVGCNSVTIFRHFAGKRTLLEQVVERFHRLELDEEALHSRLSYMNVHGDLTVIASCFFELLFDHIHILRVFISDGALLEDQAKDLWYLPAPCKDFVRDYLVTVYPDGISPADAALIAEMFVSFITRTCLRVNVQEGAEEHSRAVAREAREVMAPSVDMVADLCLLHVRRARGRGEHRTAPVGT